MIRIAVLCPSRGRPARLESMAESLFRTAASPERVELVLRLDEDDPDLPGYGRVLAGDERGRITRIFGPRRSIPEALNAIAPSLEHDVIGTAADDVLFRTAAWDCEVERALGDGGRAAIAVPMDGREERRGLRCTHFFATRAWVRTVGHLLHPDYEHFWADTNIADIAARADRLVWMREVLVEHLHPNAGKAPRDATYADKRAGPKGARMSDRDADRYERLAGERAAAAARVRSGTDG